MMPGGVQPLLPCGNGGFGHVDDTGPTHFPQTFKAPTPPRQSLLCPDYLMNALAAKKHAGTEYCDDEFKQVKNEPNWVGFNNNQDTVYTSQVSVENFGGLLNNKYKEAFGCDQNTNLFVGNLPSNCSENALWDLFSTYGDVTDVRIAKKYDSDRQVPGFAFVGFLDPDSAARVLDSKPIKLFGDHRLNVQRKESLQMKRGDDKSKSSPTRHRNDLDSRKYRSRSRSKTRSRKKRSNSRSLRPSHSRRRRSRSRSMSRWSSSTSPVGSRRRRSPVRSRTLIRAPKRRRSRSSQDRSAKRPRGSSSVCREEHRRKVREEKEYELERLRHVRRREERLKEDEKRIRDQMDGGKMREEEEQVRKLKRERLAREKNLHLREKSLMRLKEEQENRIKGLRRSISRDRTPVERRIRMRSRSRHRSRSRSRGSSRRIKSSSEISSSSRQTSSSRSVFDGNRLGGKISVKTRLGKRRSRSKSRD